MTIDSRSSGRSPMWRWFRWIVVTTGVVALWACTDHPLAPPAPNPQRTEKNVFQQAINRDVDIVFEIDNSISMAPEQANLVANFPTFINILKTLPGGLPNVHIAVITSDMGAGVFGGGVEGCGHPDNGNFIGQVRVATDPVCATARLNPGQHFIESLNGGSQNNFTGDITDVFRCIAQVGTSGCGFEDHLESVRAALGDSAGDPARGIAKTPVLSNNAGFLRTDAYLAVILITNEEECSTAPDNVLFNPDPASDATLGPLTARCFAHTDICDGQRMINYVLAGNAVGPFQNCVSDEATFNADRTQGAIPVQFYIDYLKKQKSDAGKILLSGIIAPTSPYSLVKVPDPQGQGQVIAQGNSCTGAAGVFGQPTPRLDMFFNAFSPQQVVRTSICDTSFAPAMQLIAERLSQLLGSSCIRGTVLATMGPMGSRPDCSVVDHATNAQGVVINTVLPSCVDNGSQPPCWNLAPGTGAQCPGQQIMQIMRPPNQPAPTELNTSVECSIAACAQGVHNPPNCP